MSEYVALEVDVSEALDKRALFDVATRYPGGSEPKNPGTIEAIEARNLPVNFDIYVNDGTQAVPFRNIDAATIEGRFDGDDLMITTLATSGTSLLLLLRTGGDR